MNHKCMIYKDMYADLKSPARKGVPVRFRLRGTILNQGFAGES